jgi:hypothetical protein
MSIRNISWGIEAAGVSGPQPYQLHVLTVLECGNIKLLEPLGPVQGLLYLFTYK